MWYLDHVSAHQRATYTVNHVIEMKRYEDGIVAKEKAKLSQIEFGVAYLVMTLEAIDIVVVFPVSDLHVEHILDLEHIAGIGVCCIQRRVGLCEITSVALWHRTEIFVDVKLGSPNAISLAYQPVKQAIIVCAY